LKFNVYNKNLFAFSEIKYNRY